jgi:CBS-domain-containing membrane protein
VRGARGWLGIELDEVSGREKAISAVGGTIAILAIYAASHHVLDLDGAAMIVATMGASAVLLFAVPHGALSQPWPTTVGHVVSAVIGVACARHIPNRELAAAVAVGASIAAMHQLRAVHPPGGATALTAVIGAPAVQALGWSYVLRPVLLNVAILLVVAVAFNLPFRWRRYPSALAHRDDPAPAPDEATHDEIVAALRSMESFIDVTEEDVRELVRLLAPRRPGSRPTGP